jgi:hypothetical protein
MVKKAKNSGNSLEFFVTLQPRHMYCFWPGIQLFTSAAGLFTRGDHRSVQLWDLTGRQNLPGESRTYGILPERNELHHSEKSLFILLTLNNGLINVFFKTITT